MGREYERTTEQPKVFTGRDHHVNQPFYYLNSRMDQINSRFGEVQQTIGNHGQVHKIFSKQLKVQQNYTQTLEGRHEDLKGIVEEKIEIQQEILMKLDRYEEEKSVLKEQFEKLIQSKNILEEQVIHLETAKNDLYAEIDQHRTHLKEQELQFQKVEHEQSDQKIRHDELVQQVGLQEIDHEDLLTNVKDNVEKQKVIQMQVEELLDRTAALVLQHREQEKMHLELYTQLIKHKAVSTEATKHLQQSLASLNSDLKRIQSKDKSTMESMEYR